jgi:hypothetical protein
MDRQTVDSRSIELTEIEVRSGIDRLRWAEGLIRQLPSDHEGRNSWLLNFGQGVDPAAVAPEDERS